MDLRPARDLTLAHLYGYARVSTGVQDPALQTDALTAVGCARIFTDRASGKLDRRPELDKLLEVILPGDVVIVWRLDRLRPQPETPGRDGLGPRRP